MHQRHQAQQKAQGLFGTGLGFDTHTLTRSPTCLQVTAKHQVTAASKPTALSPWCWAPACHWPSQPPIPSSVATTARKRQRTVGPFQSVTATMASGNASSAIMRVSRRHWRCLHSGRTGSRGGTRPCQTTSRRRDAYPVRIRFSRLQALVTGEGGGPGSNVTAGIPLRRWVSRSVSRSSASAVRAWTRGVAFAFRQ